MNSYRDAGRQLLFAAALACYAIWVESSPAQLAGGGSATNEIRIVELQGEVEVSPAGATTWVLTQTNQILRSFDRLHTGANSRVALRWSDKSVVLFGASTELEILPPHRPEAQSGLHIVRGIISFFHRDEPGRIHVITRGAAAGVEGTEFVVAVASVDGTERTTLSVIDGKVQFGNEQGTLLLTNSQQASAESGNAPVRTAAFVANDILQWCFYYPVVLDLADVTLSPEEENTLRESLGAYAAGDLLAALAKYPPERQPGSEAERIYYAALLLSVGEVEKAESTLASIPAGNAAERTQQLANALRQLIRAVKRQPDPSDLKPRLATEFLANSYYEQSRGVSGVSLKTALELARQAVAHSPQFGFAWTRVAELEFSFGHITSAMHALDRALALTPRNPQALALEGFLLASRTQTHEAMAWFDRALAVDSALGNAWLGRGLCRIRRGDTIGGREDLLVAAALEPQRAELRSYLGKAFANAGDDVRAGKELQLAGKLDPNDPTPWFYSALLSQEENRINRAIRYLEKSEELNDNRSVYRSQLLLDQDRAVRGANLAAMYRDAGMSEVALREASRSVNYDYANYSAHLFLANSYAGFRDPNLVNLRYETPAENEYLLATLLAPVGAGAISPTISQQEYSRLFEQDHLGVVSSTEYLSRGAWTQSGAQYGTFEHFNYSLEAFYHTDPGQRADNDTEQRQLSFSFKQQLTPQDTAYIQVKDYKADSGNLYEYYDPKTANTRVRVNETQDPIVGLGYHHEWSPGVHTLLFVTRLDDTLSETNQAAPTLVAFKPDVNSVPTLTSVQGITMHQQFVGKLEIYSAELQQIWQQHLHSTVIGGRIQYGHFHTANLQLLPSDDAAAFPDPPQPAARQDITSLFERLTFYGYHQWQIVDSLELIGGISYDWLTFPENFQTAPISSKEKTADQVSPKAGVIWTPAQNTAVRFAYTRSLAGASLDQSYRLEPPQVAGFVQSFRSIIPESVLGPTAGAKFETYGISLDQKFHTGTYLGISGELLNSRVQTTVGTFDVLPDEFNFAIPSGLREQLDYREQSLLVTANQLFGEEWSIGAQYRLSQAILKDNFVDVPASVTDLVDFRSKQRLEGVLHHLNLFAIYNHPSGFFAEQEALWYAQSNSGYAPDEPGDEFWQFNAFAGYRFRQRKAELAIGLLNMSDQDYRLNPLNIYNELPRRRTLTVRFQLNF